MADINSNLPVADTTDGSAGSAVPSMAQQVGGSDGTNLRALSVDTTGKLNINNVSGTVSLPTGAATSALQTTGNSSLSSIDGKLVDNFGAASGALRVASLPGNASGIADFGAGATGAQTPRITANITRNGTELSYGAGTTDANTQRVVLPTDQSAIPASQSGTWTVQQGTPPWSVVGNVASAASDSGNPVKVAAVFNSTLPTVTTGQRVDTQADANGRLIVNSTPVDGVKTTYSATIVGLSAANTPTDIFTITGSGTKTVRITRISFSGTQNTSAARDVLLIKRSTANSGGTSTTPTIVPHDSNSAAGTAIVRAYTVNPTSLGSTVGTIRAKRFQLLATNVTNPLDSVEWNFGNRPSQAIVLRGTGEVLAVNLNSVTSSNDLLDIDIEWTEE